MNEGMKKMIIAKFRWLEIFPKLKAYPGISIETGLTEL